MNETWAKAFQVARNQNQFDHEYDSHTGKRIIQEERKRKRAREDPEGGNDAVDDGEDEEFGAFSQPVALSKFIHSYSDRPKDNKVQESTSVAEVQKVTSNIGSPQERIKFIMKRKRRRRLNMTLSLQL